MLSIKDSKYILLLPFIIWASLPQLAFNLPSRILSLFCLGTFIAFNILELIIQKNKKTPVLFFIIPGFIIYIFFMNALNSSEVYILRHLQLIIYLIFALISLRMIKEKPKFARTFVFIILITNLLISLNTIYGLSLNKYIARSFAQSNEATEELAKSGFAGYSLVYTNILFLPFLFLSLSKSFQNLKENFLLFLLSFLNIIAIYWLTIVAGYSMALGASILAALLVFLLRKTKLANISLIALVATVCYFFYKSKNFILSTIEFTKGTHYNKKMLDLLASSESNSSVGTVALRLEAYLKSLGTFFENPIFGFLNFDLGNKIGGHSDILDGYAQWGILVGTILIFSIFKYYFRIIKIIDPNYKKYIIIAALMIFIVALFNTIPLQFGLVLIFGSSLLIIFPSLMRIRK